MKKEITGVIPEAATHAEINWYKTNENACNCNLMIIDEETETVLVQNRIYRIDNLPFELTAQEVSFLTGEKPDETWPEELTQEFLDLHSLSEVPEDWNNSYDPGTVPTYAEIKQAAKNQQQATLRQGCPTSLGFTIDCLPHNVADFAQTLSLISIYPTVTEVVVRDYDNINHTVTVEQYQQMCVELGAHVMATRQAYWSEIDESL